MEIFCLRAHETVNSVLSFLVPPKRFRVNAVSYIVDATILFSNSDNNSASFSEKFSCPIADITETLDNNFFASDSRLYTKFLWHFLITKNLPSWIEYTQSCWFRSASNTHLVNMLSCGDSWCINITMTIEILISVFD